MTQRGDSSRESSDDQQDVHMSDIIAWVGRGAFLDKGLKAVAILRGDIQELDADSVARIRVPDNHRGIDKCGPEYETQAHDGPCWKHLPRFDERASNTDVAQTFRAPSEESILTEPDLTIESDAWIDPALGHV